MKSTRPFNRGIVTLCGSVRNKDLFEYANAELTKEGFIVLSVGYFDHHALHQADNDAEHLKARLDKLHKEKIDLSNAVLILNRDDYIGKSTKSELEYADSKHKRIYYYEPFSSMYELLKGVDFNYEHPKETVIDAKVPSDKK